MIVLYNPTDESMTMQHAGISRTLEPDTRLEVEDACGKHVLNSHGMRGLCQLTYGCDEGKIQKEGIARNYEFKKKQVVEYNQRNESRKQMGLPYQPPTPHIKQYAIDLGLELLEPFAVRDAERKAISDSKEENTELREMVANLARQVAEMTKAMSNPPEPKIVYRAPARRKGSKKV